MDEKKLSAILAAIIVILLVGWLISFIRSPSPAIEEEGIKKAVSRLGSVIRLDPLKHCEVYKQEGCSHVDGPLCDVETCNVVVESEMKKVIPIKQVRNG